jgi:hypothetical protein
MTTLTFRGHQYEHREVIAQKSNAVLTYRRLTYQARQVDTRLDGNLCAPEGFIRSARTAQLLGIALEPCSLRHLKYRGVAYVR